MIKIALTIIHNKTPEENEQQIRDLLSRIEERQALIPGFDEDGAIIPDAFIRHYYVFPRFPLPHEIDVYQIVPYQPENTSEPYSAVLPANFNDLKSYSVHYGKGDEDKTGDHPRFFNWGLKRGTDNGADVSVLLHDVKDFDLIALAVSLNSLIDPNDKHEFVEDEGMKITSLRTLREVGQLREDRSLSEAISNYKTRINQKGMRVG